MITMSTFGNNGRMGNQIFQYAAMIGIAKKHNRKLVLPKWEHADCFEGVFPEGEVPDNVRFIQEPVFNYLPNFPQINEHDNVDIKGYFQSEFYWHNAKEEVKKALTFKQSYKDQVWDNFFRRSKIKDDFRVDGKKSLAISIRRGDYVGNAEYHQLPVTYYINALFERFPDWQERNIIIFSDDIPWTRVHFGCLSNVFFSENNSPIEDICLMSQCNGFIIANSTFGWWGAALAEMQNPVPIVRPARHFAGELRKKNDERDLYPSRWQVFDNLDHFGHEKKINLKDFSFHIPVYHDSNDRQENLDLCIQHIQKYFDCEIIVMEQGGSKFDYAEKKYDVVYKQFPGEIFHRTRMLNQMVRLTERPGIFNWDADVLIAPLQIWMTAQKIREGSEMVYPYWTQFARMPRKIWYTRLRDFCDIGIVGDTQFSGQEHNAAMSVGGAVAWNKESFLNAGGENEIAISYDCEDVERCLRATKLGLRIERVHGPMYHLDHWCGPNSSKLNPYYGRCQEDVFKQKEMTKEQLIEYVKDWPRGL